MAYGLKASSCHPLSAAFDTIDFDILNERLSTPLAQTDRSEHGFDHIFKVAKAKLVSLGNFPKLKKWILACHRDLSFRHNGIKVLFKKK